MVIRFGTMAPPPWCSGGSQWVDGKGAGLKAVACTSDQSDRWSSRVVGDPRGCREIYRPDGALAAGETLLGSLRWGDLEGSKDWGAFGHCRGHALARGCIAQGKLVVTCRATARLHSETSSASWPFCASLVTSADAPASIFAAPPERVYVIEIKAAYPPRLIGSAFSTMSFFSISPAFPEGPRGASGPFDALAGLWSGNGVVQTSDGLHERVRCKAT